MRAVVVFSDGDDPPRWWARMLTPGFRHVEVFLQTNPPLFVESGYGGYDEAVPASWVGVAGGTGDLVVMPVKVDPRQWAHERGMLYVETLAQPKSGGWRWLGRVDCTAVVKSILGIRSWRILTPRHLFLHIIHKGPKC